MLCGMGVAVLFSPVSALIFCFAVCCPFVTATDIHNEGYIECGHNLVNIKGQCYLFRKSVNLPMIAALRYCREKHGELLQARTLEENNRIKNYLKHFDPQCSSAYWLGITSILTSKHTSLPFFGTIQPTKASRNAIFLDKSTPSYTDWSPKEPNGFEDQNCTQFRCSSTGTWGWNDEKCTAVYMSALICQQNECPANCRQKSSTKSFPTPHVSGQTERKNQDKGRKTAPNINMKASPKTPSNTKRTIPLKTGQQTPLKANRKTPFGIGSELISDPVMAVNSSSDTVGDEMSTEAMQVTTTAKTASSTHFTSDGNSVENSSSSSCSSTLWLISTLLLTLMHSKNTG